MACELTKTRPSVPEISFFCALALAMRIATHPIRTARRLSDISPPGVLRDVVCFLRLARALAFGSNHRYPSRCRGFADTAANPLSGAPDDKIELSAFPVRSPLMPAQKDILAPERQIVPTKVGFVSLGCPKNLVDSEVMMGMLAHAGAELTPAAEDADVIVVNTCSFIGSAQQESIDTILEMTRHKTS